MSVSRIQNYLLYTYILTGVFAQHPNIYMINNIIMLLFIASSFLTKPAKYNSKIFYLYAIIAFISIFNQLFYAALGEFEYSPHYISVPMILLLLYAVNRIKLKFTFEDFVLANVMILPVLFLLGGFATVGGRIHTNYLHANLNGMFVFFGFMVSTRNVLKNKILLPSLILMVFTALFLVLSGSRQNIILLLIGSFFLIYPILKEKYYFKKYRLVKKMVLSIVMLIGIGFVINKGIHQLSERFGDIQQLQAQIRGEESEYSMLERLNFITTAFVTISKGYITGVGQGNTKHAIEQYGEKMYKVTNNSHSVMAEFLFSAGIIGALVLMMMLYRMKYLFWNKKKYRYQYGYVFIYFILAIFAIPLIASRIFWVLVVILEREILKNERTENEKNIIGK
jgi:hypothetical protein